MKKIFTISILLFQLTFVFGQSSDWGSFGTISCYQGLQGACKNLGYVKSINQYSWNVRLKNNYSKKAHVTFYYSIGGEKIDVGLVSIAPGGTYTHTSLYVKNNSTSYYITVVSVCFANSWAGCGNNSSSEMCFADCDNGSPNIPTNCGAGKSNSSSNNSNQQTSQQNDLSEYNRSKADLERQMAEKNTEIQRQNLENQRQQFNRLFNEGNSLKSSGNFGAAKNRFNDALKFATNDSERQQVQQALNQNEADSKTYLINSGIELTNTISTGIQQQKEWSAEQKRLKAGRLQQAVDYMRNLEQKFINEINLANNGDFDKQNWVAYQFYDKQKYESAEEYYHMAISNKNVSSELSLNISNYLASCYAINGKYLEQWDELNKRDKRGNLLFYNTFQRSMLILFSKEFEVNKVVSDEMIELAIQDLKNTLINKEDAKVALAYLQVTGEYQLQGLPKSETAGLEILEKTTNSELASYFMGELYLQGVGVKKDERKAFDSFLNVVKLNKNQKNYKKFNVNSKSDLDFYKPIHPRHDIYQLTPLIMAYSKIAIILEKSSKDSDRKLLKYKNEFFEWFGNLLTIEDRTFWKINIVENPFLQTKKK